MSNVGLRKRVIFTWVFLAAIAAWLSVQVYLSLADPPITESDLKFISSVKRDIRQVGDTARVSDIYPGDWAKVCVNPLSAYKSIDVSFLKGEGLRRNALHIVNTDNTYANDNVWGIYFIYPDDRVEYFHIPWPQMTNIGGGCAERSRASFRAVGDFDQRQGISSEASISADHITLKLESIQSP